MECTSCLVSGSGLLTLTLSLSLNSHPVQPHDCYLVLCHLCSDFPLSIIQFCFPCLFFLSKCLTNIYSDEYLQCTKAISQSTATYFLPFQKEARIWSLLLILFLTVVYAAYDQHSKQRQISRNHLWKCGYNSLDWGNQ